MLRRPSNQYHSFDLCRPMCLPRTSTSVAFGSVPFQAQMQGTGTNAVRPEGIQPADVQSTRYEREYTKGRWWSMEMRLMFDFQPVHHVWLLTRANPLWETSNDTGGPAQLQQLCCSFGRRVWAGCRVVTTGHTELHLVGSNGMAPW